MWAWAKIISSSQGPVNTFKVARVEMQLEVHTPGTPAYPAKVIWLVDQESLGFVEQGKELSLKVEEIQSEMDKYSSSRLRGIAGANS